jgi:hypothetical protein
LENLNKSLRDLLPVFEHSNYVHKELI